MPETKLLETIANKGNMVADSKEKRAQQNWKSEVEKEKSSAEANLFSLN